MSRVPNVLSPVSRPSLVDEVAERLTNFVIAEQTAGKTHLPAERAIAEMLGVSRPIVREATKRLEHQGLLEIKQGIGTRIVKNLHKPIAKSLSLLALDNHERFRQLAEIRLALEGMSARLAAERITESTLLELRKHFESHREAVETGVALYEDLVFHRTIAEISENKILCLVFDSLSDLIISGMKIKMNLKTGVRRESVVAHEKILEAIGNRDPDEAEMRMNEHITQASNGILEILES